MWQGLTGKEQKIQILNLTDPSVELPVQTHAQQPSFVWNNGAIFKIRSEDPKAFPRRHRCQDVLWETLDKIMRRTMRSDGMVQPWNHWVSGINTSFSRNIKWF